MSDHVFLVLTNPTPGVEDEYNDWRAPRVAATWNGSAAQTRW